MLLGSVAKLISNAGLSNRIASGRNWCRQSKIKLEVKKLIRLQHVTAPPDSQKNFLVVDSKTDNAAIEEAFERFTTERKDIGILLINQHVRAHVVL